MPEAESWLQGCSRKKLGFPHATRAPRHGDTFLGFTSLPLPLCHPPALQQALAVPVNTNPQTQGWQDGAQVGRACSQVLRWKKRGRPGGWVSPCSHTPSAVGLCQGRWARTRLAERPPGGGNGSPLSRPAPPGRAAHRELYCFPTCPSYKGPNGFSRNVIKK